MKILGFVKVRNEIIREGNLARVLRQCVRYCDGGVLCDDASTDGTYEELQRFVTAKPGWDLLRIEPEDHDWSRELFDKQRMLDALKARWCDGADEPKWVFWLDADEMLDPDPDRFRRWLETSPDHINVWGFPYIQLWRTTCWARTDSGFDDACFWKLWRLRPDLAFEVAQGLHAHQFPKNYLDDVMRVVQPNSRQIRERMRRERRRGPWPAGAAVAPYSISHLGNVGKNLVWKAIAYRDSGRLAEASLKRHLYFDDKASYRRVGSHRIYDLFYPLPRDKEAPMPFTDQEKAIIERMGTLRSTNALMVVIVPTYNRGYALDRTLASLLSQTYDHWVCIVLDDGSTDSTPEIMRRWQDRDPRFFYCRYEMNRGGVVMNEIGMRLACEFGEFWTRLGSDDYFEPHKLELDILAFGAGAQACYGPYVDLQDKVGGGVKLGRDIRNPPHDANAALREGRFDVSWANVAVHTRVLREVRERYGSFADPRLRNMEDYLVNVRIAQVADFVWRGLVGDEFLVGDWRKVNRRNIHPDAVWRIGADGASSNEKVCAEDTAITRAIIEKMGLSVLVSRPESLLKRMPRPRPLMRYEPGACQDNATSTTYSADASEVVTNDEPPEKTHGSKGFGASFETHCPNIRLMVCRGCNHVGVHSLNDSPTYECSGCGATYVDQARAEAERLRDEAVAEGERRIERLRRDLEVKE